LVGGCAATTTQFVPSPPGEISAPNNGMSRIIAYRFSGFYGSALGYRISLNNKSIGELGPKGFLYWDAEPGFKTLEARADAVGQSTSGWKQFTSEGNDLIVLRIGVGPLFGDPAPPIRILSGTEKEKLLSELKPAPSNSPTTSAPTAFTPEPVRRRVAVSP
jgi:hypothetical protein